MDYVYGIVKTWMDDEPLFFVVPREAAEENAEIIELLDGCSTWGELRKRATPERYQELLGLAGYGTIEEATAHLMIGHPVPGALHSGLNAYEPDREPPADEEPFDGWSDLGAAADGDYPPDIRYLQNLHLPADLITEYGERYHTIYNGEYANFPPAADTEAVVLALKQRGHSVERNDDFVRRAIRT